MGRILKRVPMDFDAPLDEIWKGYLLENASKEDFEKFPVKSCDECREKNGKKKDFCNEEGTPYCVHYNSKWRKLWFEEVPEGEGYQMWENTTEGSPQTPVFKTLQELSEYCANNCTTFAHYKTTKEKWYKMLEDDKVHHTKGNTTFV